jgi:hypothetical protein
LVPAGASAADPPDPLDRGEYTVERVNPFTAGLATLQEPQGSGNPPGTTSNASVTLQIRGDLYRPSDYAGKSPLIVLVHGNHGSCDDAGDNTLNPPTCDVYKRNDSGYAYLGENLASWGYTVASLDQDQMMMRQDGFARGMHQRRLLIMALLDAFYEANENGLAITPDSNIGDLLKGKLDMTRIGLMGHSRGGDAVASFIDYNRMRPEGRRYPLRGVISLAPVDYERRAPYGVPFMSILPTCDGDVSNLQGARLFERSQYIEDDPYPSIQSSQVGGNHNWYNTVWEADGEDNNPATEEACSISSPTSIRMSGDALEGLANTGSYAMGGTNVLPVTADKLNPEINTRISGDPARMGDQEKVGLATMSAFFRRYVGGEGAFEPYMTGELAEEGKPQVPTSACPTSTTGTKISCLDRVSTSFFPPAEERLDVIRPDVDEPLAMSALGTPLKSSGFANPFLKGGGVSPRPGTTASGLDWCNPEPKQAEPVPLGEDGYPTAMRPCPLPAPSALGGQSGVREQGPVNQSYSRQLAVAWEKPAAIKTTIPAASSDVSGYKVLALAAAVNFFDTRNPARSVWDPQVGMQDFTVAVTDGSGKEATVEAGDPRYGTALQQTHGSTSAKVHVILDQIRIPLTDLAEQGVDLTDLRGLELRFGDGDNPASGSIQLADVRFQESTEGTEVLLDSTAPDAGPGEGLPDSGPNPLAEIEAFDRAPESMRLPTVTTQAGASVWTVDDDKTECPTAEFTTVQAAVDFAAPWDTIVICDGLYEESSVPANAAPSPAQERARNGLTIKKPLKIIGAGADKVTIRPAASMGATIAGTEPYLRDGGGNVITISRQSMGSSEFSEIFVDISGVTVESPFAYAEAGIAFFNSSGRVSDSVVGPFSNFPTSTGTLTSRPHGWGIVATNSLIGQGPGTILRQVTVADSVVKGYATGGILFDDAYGKDAALTAKEPSGILLKGVVTDSVVEGRGPVESPTFTFPQTGIQYHAGAEGFVQDTKVTGNMLRASEPGKSFGILLTGADTSNWYMEGSLLSGNGFGLFNADVANTAISTGTAAEATGNWWGATGTPTEYGLTGPDIMPAGSADGVSKDASVLYSPVLGGAPTITAPGSVPDVAPTGSMVDPGDGAEVAAGTAVEPIVLADDDFGVKSVTLTADGKPVATLSSSPYAFSWTPGADEAGTTVVLEATITDSSGQTAVDSIEVEVKAVEKPAPTPEVKPEPTPTPVVGPPSTGKATKDTEKGTAQLAITAPGAGKLVISGFGVRKVTKTVTGPVTIKSLIKPIGKKLKTLNETGKVTVKVKVTFTAADGTVTKTTRTLTLVKK